MTARSKVLARIADHLDAWRPGHPLRVAVDGITASGKTTFASELTAALRARGRPVIRLSMDGFHHPRAHRYRQGRGSAVGYYEDAYDFSSFARLVLAPLGPEGDGHYRERIIDLPTDEAVDEPPQLAEPDAVLVVDGSFLQRDVLAGLWDQVVFVDTSFDIARRRGSQRDAEALGGVGEAETAFRQRYHAACEMYLAEVHPAERATIVVTNNDLECPVLQRIGGSPTDTALLFSYGTLRQAGVQLSSFGRLLDGAPDALPGFRMDWVTITDQEVIRASGSDRHPIVRASGDLDARVDGTVLTITTAELAAADDYEVEGYRRVLVRLASGLEAWVYLAASGPAIGVGRSEQAG